MSTEDVHDSKTECVHNSGTSEIQTRKRKKEQDTEEEIERS